MSNNSSYLCHSRDFHVENVTVINSCSSRTFNAFDYLHDSIAIDAVHNSQDRYNAPKCHPETRTAVQEEIFGWITHGDEDAQPMQILWLTGPAGAGKTAIAGIVADACDERELLAGSFFFSSFTGSEKRRSRRYLVATLAYQLVLQLGDDHPLRQAVLAAIQRDPSVFRRQLKDQLRIVLVKPFHDTRTQFDTSVLPNVFIIDGLDEVEASNSRQAGKDLHEARIEDEKDQEEILSALLYAANNPDFPFRIVIASRPEPAIRAFFSADAAVHLTREIFLDEKYNPDSDIDLFLNAKFAEIRRRYRLPHSWPSAEDIRRLVYAASGQFIYAATIIRFLQNTKHLRGPQALLRTILDWRSEDAGGSALAPLDALYTRILMSGPDPLLAAQWVGAINQFGLHEAPALFVNQLLQKFEGQGVCLLENLSSLIWIPPIEDESSPYKIYHKSLLDFLGGRASNEIQDAFSRGPELFFDRSLVVFRDKFPCVSISGSTHNTFIRHFINGPWQVFDWALIDALTPDEPSKWDVAWWAHRLAATLGADGGFRSTPLLFETIHKLCRNASRRPGDCLPSCRLWRSNIIRVYKGYGWSVPNEITLLREAMWYGSYHPYYLLSWDIECYIRPTGNPGSPRSLPGMQESSTSYTVDEDYQALLDVVAAMFSRLPSDWRLRYLKEVGNDESKSHTALSSVIETIAIDMGVEVEVPTIGPRHKFVNLV